MAGFGQSQSLAWARTFNGTLNKVEWFAESAVDSSGNTYVSGTTNVNSDQSQADIVLLKYSPNGQLVWSRTFDGPAHGSDVANNMVIGDDGNIYVVGYVTTLSTSSDMVTLKYSPSGTLVWSRQHDGPASSVDVAYAVAADANGNVAVAGEVWADHVPYSNGDFSTIVYRPDGSVKWESLHNGPANFIAVSDQPRQIKFDHNGDVVVAGDSPFSDNEPDLLTLKYRGSDGAQLWERRYNAMPSSENLYSLHIAPNNDVVVGGNTQSNGILVALLRYNATSGATTWETVEAFPHGGRLRSQASMTLDPAGNPVISVTYDPDVDNSNLNYNIQTTKYSFATGGRLWSVSYGNTARYDGQSADAVTTDAAGKVYVGGGELVVPNNLLAVWKFDATDGHLVWRQTYNGPKQPDVTHRIHVTDQGEVFLAGLTGVDVGTGDSDLQVVKFSRKVPRLLPHG